MRAEGESKTEEGPDQAHLEIVRYCWRAENSGEDGGDGERAGKGRRILGLLGYERSA